MSATIVHRLRAVLSIRMLMTLLLLAQARAICAAMLAAIGRFPSPVPALAVVLGQANDLETAQQAVSAGTHGVATAVRNTARKVLWASLQSLKAYVQATADANEADAVEIIKSAGFDVAQPLPPRSKPILDAKLTAIPGEVKLVANASALTGGSKKRVTYNWEYSTDGGHTWIAVQSTPTASTTIVGLALLSNPSFRVSVLLAGVVQEWSQVVTILVH